MKLQIYDSDYQLYWETNDCFKWIICNGENNEYSHSYLKINFDDENIEHIFRLNIQHFYDIQEPFFLVLDTCNGLKRFVIYNLKLQSLHHSEYIFFYDFYVTISIILLNIPDCEFSNFLRQVHQNYLFNKHNNIIDNINRFKKQCSNIFKEILDKELKEFK